MYYCSHCDGGGPYIHKTLNIKLCSNCGIEWDPLYMSEEDVEKMLKTWEPWRPTAEDGYPSSDLNGKYNPDEDEAATPVLNYIPTNNEEYPPSDYDDDDNLIDEERYCSLQSFDEEELQDEDENILVQENIPILNYIQQFWEKLKKAIA